MFPYTNDSNANFWHKNAAQGGEQEARRQVQYKERNNTFKKIVHVISKVKTLS